ISKEHLNSSNDISYALYAANGNQTPPAGRILVGNTEFSALGSSALSLNKWVFMASTYDGSTLRTYVNGNQVGSQKISRKGGITTTSDPLTIGGDWAKEMFTGLIDNARIYNQALSQSAINSDMNSAVVLPPAPVANAGSKLTVNEGNSVTFSGSVTGGTTPFAYSWNF